MLGLFDGRNRNITEMRHFFQRTAILPQTSSPARWLENERQVLAKRIYVERANPIEARGRCARLIAAADRRGSCTRMRADIESKK